MFKNLIILLAFAHSCQLSEASSNNVDYNYETVSEGSSSTYTESSGWSYDGPSTSYYDSYSYNDYREPRHSEPRRYDNSYYDNYHDYN